ncbi:helix-turn-helix domain-containing protein [Streptomyces rhizosphaericus]|uniref:helix-turn-helix domain-containing protein n=1 Tax=Streptomyces rhizosphaericus TaxID=114699 RepID=UPI000A3B00A7|nr:helix-turn-helix transcriptional regulator [Streptomyces rhizosphaericus]
MRMTKDSEPETSESLKTFGAVLKALRDEAGLTQEQFAPRVRYSATYVAKMEQGRRFPPKELIPRTEEVLGAPAARVLGAAYRSLTRRVGLASWVLHWAGIEEEAVSLLAYDCAVVPGLLQPEPYIRTVFDRYLPHTPTQECEQQVIARLARQQLFTDLPSTSFCFIIEQALLERHFGGSEITRALLDHLLEQQQRRNVEIQIMPLRQEDHSGADGSMRLAETMEHRWLGYIEGHGSSILITDPEAVSAMHQPYGKLRSQALSPQDTTSLLEQMRGAL